ncbi:MAG: C40 family peptidase [Bacteroidia bacterium]
MKLGKLTFMVIVATLILASCGSTRDTSRYDYLREKSARTTEPYDIIDLAVLDTVTSKPKPRPRPTPPSPPKTDKPGRADKTTRVAIKTARNYLGVPYRFGGMDRKGMDCSALMMLSYKAAGKTIPRTSSAQSQTGKRLKKSQIRPGDLVFFDSNLNGRINHVGLVTEVRSNDIVFIHATTSRGVVEDVISNSYYQKRYKRAMRP